MRGGWFSPGTPVFATNKTDCDITEILFAQFPALVLA